MDVNSPSYFEKESLIFRDKYVFPYLGLILHYHGLIFQKVRDLGTRKFVDKYILRVSRLNPFVHNERAISERMASWGTLNSRRAALRLAFGRTPRLSQTGLRTSRLGSAYKF